MPDTHDLANTRPVFNTRGSVVAAWFVATVVAWPILTIAITFLWSLGVAAILNVFDPGLLRSEILVLFMSYVISPSLFFASAIVTALAGSKFCRYLTTGRSDLQSLASDIRTLLVAIVVITAVVATYGWAELGH